MGEFLETTLDFDPALALWAVYNMGLQRTLEEKSCPFLTFQGLGTSELPGSDLLCPPCMTPAAIQLLSLHNKMEKGPSSWQESH